MLDENLPSMQIHTWLMENQQSLTQIVAFLLRPSSDKPKQNETFFYSQYGADFEPSYNVRHLDPEQHGSRNRYAVGIYDAYIPDVLYGEVLSIPEWTQPTLSAEEIRRNNGVPPPPEPILPTEFVIQLYNPDQQVHVRYRPAGFTRDATWEFELPIQTFREPSTSTLDRSQHDPVAMELTPKLSLKWKKDGKFSKDLACYQSGRSLNPDGTKKRNKEADITMAIFRNLKEMTLYEPNLMRIEIEDMKGLEVVLLLGAVVIRDIYFTPMKQTFNLESGRKSSQTSPQPTLAVPQPVLGGTLMQSPTMSPNAGPSLDSRIPPTDPRTQWELDAETARLRRQAAEEEKVRQRRDEEEQKRIRKMLEAEEKQQRRHQESIDKETQRLIKLYGREDASARPALPMRPAQPDPRRASAYAATPLPQIQEPGPWNGPSHPTANAPYMTGAASQSSFLTPNGPGGKKVKQKSSIFGFRRSGSDEGNKLSKKRSSMF